MTRREASAHPSSATAATAADAGCRGVSTPSRSTAGTADSRGPREGLCASESTGGIDEIRQGNRVRACVDSSLQRSIYSGATHASSNCASRRGARVHARGNDGAAVRGGGRHLEEDDREVLLEEILVEVQRIEELE